MVARAVTEPGRAAKVLDVAAGHGIFGLMVAQHNPAAQIYAVDWANVLEVAREHAAQSGVADRYHAIPGSAFEAELGTDYDVILLPNFLHHFDPPTNVKLLQRLRAAMQPSGVLATVEFVPDEDRVSPPIAAAFSLMMLGGTPAGDAYTFTELDSMFREAGFGYSEVRDLAPAPQQLILTRL
jgi:2-polyprenyl-3-methyl-5-hydroxy-6-metoxy-1,4-benzoquinol methylase